MRISIQIFVTARKAITIESSERRTPEACMAELNFATERLQIDKVKTDLIDRFGDD